MIVALMKMLRQATTHVEKKPGSIPSKELRDLDPMVLEPPTKTEGVELEIMDESKTVVDWINGHAKQRTTVDAVRAAQKETTGGAEASIYVEELMPGRYTFFGNTGYRS